MACVGDEKRGLGHRLKYCARQGASGSARRTVAALCAAAIVVAGCGSGERSFSAQEFVDEANANGASLALGTRLGGEQAEIYALRVGAAAGPDGAPAAEAGSGSLRVEDSSDAAEAQYARCEQAGLFCYRAANVVLVFEADVDPELARRPRAGDPRAEDGLTRGSACAPCSGSRAATRRARTRPGTRRGRRPAQPTLPKTASRTSWTQW